MTVPTSAGQLSGTGGTRADLVYREVRQQIGSGSLRPGQKVTERGMAERLSVSPTPVREALRRLELDGLIERLGPRTVLVAAIRDAAIDDLAEVEVGLRGLVARFAARHATADQLDALDAILDRGRRPADPAQGRATGSGQPTDRHLTALLDTMQEFNDTVSACAHNPVLVRMLEQSRVFSRPQRRELLLQRVAEDDTFGLERYTSHRALVRALRAGRLRHRGTHRPARTRRVGSRPAGRPGARPGVTGGTHRIAVIPGDGIGKEVVPAGLDALRATADRFGLDLDFDELRLRQRRLLAAPRHDAAAGLARRRCAPTTPSTSARSAGPRWCPTTSRCGAASCSSGAPSTST